MIKLAKVLACYNGRKHAYIVLCFGDLVDVVQNNLFPICMLTLKVRVRENRFGCTVVWYVLGAKPAPRIVEKHICMHG